MKAISKKPRPYVDKTEENLPENEQTVFWITAISAMDASEITAKSGESVRVDGTEVTINMSAHRRSKLYEWDKIIHHVTNFDFNDGKGAVDIKETDRDGIRKLYELLPQDVVSRIIKFANDNVEAVAAKK